MNADYEGLQQLNSILNKQL